MMRALRIAPSFRMIEMAEGALLVRGASGALTVLEGKVAEAVRRLARAVDGTRSEPAVLETLGASMPMATAQKLLAAFSPEIVWRGADGKGPRSPALDAPIAILGNGPGGEALRARLHAMGFARVDRSAPLDDLDALFASRRLVVACLESTPLESAMEVCDAAHRAEASACLFVTFEPTRIVIGPAVAADEGGCFFCSQLEGLARPERIADALPRLVSSAACEMREAPLLLELAAAEVARQALRIAGNDGPPGLFGKTLTLSADGERRLACIRTSEACPACRARARAQAERPARAPAWRALATSEPVTELAAPPWSRGARVPALGEMLRELARRGADEQPHALTTLGEHLRGTAQILAAWGQPAHLCASALFHSGYSTTTFEAGLFALRERGAVARLSGPDAEFLAFLCSTVDRARRASELRRLDRIPGEGLRIHHARTGEDAVIPLRAAADLLTLELANLADQVQTQGDPAAHAERFAPGRWMAYGARLAALIGRAGGHHVPPVFDRCRGALSPDAEEIARDAYLRATAAPSPRAELLARAIDANPWVGEPHLALATLLAASGDRSAARDHAARGIGLLLAWGTAWDKRAAWHDWLAWGAEIQRRLEEKQP